MKNQINKEALITIFLYFLYFLWWYYFAYIYPPKNVEDYKYVLGLPDWFFYSCFRIYFSKFISLYCCKIFL